MVNIRKELNEALEKLVNKAPKKTVKKVVKESAKVAKKPLTEGAGAGYTIDSTVEVTYVNSITPIKVLKTEDFFGVTQSLVLFYCDIDCQATDIEAESYMYGGKVEGDFPAKITAFTLWLDGEVDVKDISKYEYESVMNNSVTLHLRTTVGGGYLHTTYNGELADIDKEKDVKGDDIYSVECKLDYRHPVIPFIDRLVTGETYFDTYGVYDAEKDLINEFDNKDEAIEWAKANKGVYVELDHYNELYMGDIELIDSEIVWERDYTKQYDMGESLTEAKDDLTLTVKEWYTEANPDDDYSQFIDETVTFADIDNALNTHQDIYKVLGIGDSIIRERVFAKLAEIKGVDYDDIFNKWLEECKKPIKEANKDSNNKVTSMEEAKNLIKDVLKEIGVDKKKINQVVNGVEQDSHFKDVYEVYFSTLSLGEAREVVQALCNKDNIYVLPFGPGYAKFVFKRDYNHNPFKKNESLKEDLQPGLQKDRFTWVYDDKHLPTLDKIVSKGFIERIFILNGVTSIGDYAFDGFKSLRLIRIPNTVTSIGDCAFRETGFMDMYIPGSVKSIGRGAFCYCDDLQLVEMYNGVTSIGGSAFQGCDRLMDIAIPDSVTNIGEDAFFGCSSLKDVYYTGSEDDWKKIKIGDGNVALIRANIHFNSSEPEPIEESKDNKGKKRLNEKLIKRFTDEVTVDDSDVNSEDFLNELTNILGSEETYGGAILKVKDFKLNFDNRCFDDGVDSDIGCKFKALIEGDFGNNVGKRWVLFDFSDNPREYGLTWQGWWDEEDGEYYPVAEGGFSANTITTDILDAFMTKTEAGNLIYDTVEETVMEYVPVPENESLKEDKHIEYIDLLDKVESRLLNDELNRDKASIVSDGTTWWVESRGLSDRAFQILKREMKNLYPDLKYIDDISSSKGGEQKYYESLKEDKHEENPLKDLKSNIMEFESGDYVYVDYADGKIRAGGATNTGIIPDVEIDYDFDKTVDENLYDLYDAIIEKHPEYLEITED